MMVVAGPAVMVLIFIGVAVGLWYLGKRLGNLKIKLVAVMMGVLPVFGIALNFALPYMEGPSEYRTIAQGPTSREASVTTSVMIPVTTAVPMHEIDLVAKIRGTSPPKDAVRLSYQILSPVGELLEHGDLDPNPTQALKWARSFVRFQPRETGEHSLKIEIPQPVGYVDIVVRELRR